MANLPISEDPRIAQVAKLEHDSMLAELARRYAAGQDFYHARECVMAERGPEMSKKYGKDVATRALNALTSIGPAMLPRQVVVARDQHFSDSAIEAADFTHGSGHYWPKRAIWVRENQHFFSAITMTGMMSIAGCWFVAGVYVAFNAFDFSLWWPATKASAQVGIGLTLIGFLAPYLIGCGLKRKGPPLSKEELAKEQEASFLAMIEDHCAKQRAESEASEKEKAKLKLDRDYAAHLRRIADDMERAGQPRPLYSPPKRQYRRRAN